MVDFDDVRLLEPATADSMFRVSLADRPAPGEQQPGVMLLAGLHPLPQPADAAAVSLFERQVMPLVRDHGVRVEAAYVTEPGPNTFTRLPVRDGNVLVWFGTVVGSEMPAAGRLESALRALASRHGSDCARARPHAAITAGASSTCAMKIRTPRCGSSLSVDALSAGTP